MFERFFEQLNVYPPIELISDVKHHAAETKQSMSAIVEAALYDYLRKRDD